MNIINIKNKNTFIISIHIPIGMHVEDVHSTPKTVRFSKGYGSAHSTNSHQHVSRNDDQSSVAASAIDQIDH